MQTGIKKCYKEFGLSSLGATTIAAGAVVVVVEVVVVVVGSRDVVRVTWQWDNVNDAVVPVDVRASQQKTASESHLIVKVVDAADRGQAVAAQLFCARVDDRLLMDNLGGAGPGRQQIFVVFIAVEVEQGP